MARIRSIKPDFWTDEKVVELSAFARLLFIGLWNFADDDGRMPYSEKRIKMQIFPADTLNISELFGEIRREGLVDVYEVDNEQYLQIVGFSKHQKIDKRSNSKLPANPLTSPDLPRIPPTEEEGKGREREEDLEKESLEVGRASSAPSETKSEIKKSKTVRGTRLTKAWDLPEGWGLWAESQGMTREVVIRECDKFKDYWIAKSGANATKMDWEATWRNWVRNHLENYAK